MFNKKPDQQILRLTAELEKCHRMLNEMGEMARVGGWELDLATKEVYWTEEVYKIHRMPTSYRPKLNDGISFYAPESVPTISLAIKNAIEKGEPFDLELLLIPRGSRDKIRVRSIGKAIYKDGKIVKLVGTFQDITELKKIEGALREQQRVLQSVIDGIPDVVGIQKPDHTIVSYNKAGLELLKLKPEDVNGRKCFEFIGRKLPCEICATDKVVKTKVAQCVEKKVEEIGLWLECRSSPILNEKGEIELIIEILRDITSRKKIEEELAIRVNELERFQNVAVGREKRIIELKNEVRELKEQLAKK